MTLKGERVSLSLVLTGVVPVDAALRGAYGEAGTRGGREGGERADLAFDGSGMDRKGSIGLTH